MKKEDLDTLVGLYESVYSLNSGEYLSEDYIEEQGRRTGSNPNVWKPATTTSGPAGGGMGGRRGGGSSPGGIKPSTLSPAVKPAAAKPGALTPTTRPAATQPGALTPTTRPAATQPAARPATPGSGAKVAPAAAKPAGQTGDKAKDEATWAKANPKLAAAAAEKARIRGTQQTDNPLMKDMKSRLPMNSPSVQSPDVAKLGKGNQSLVSNPNAFKAATPTKAVSKVKPTAVKVEQVNSGLSLEGNNNSDNLHSNQYGSSLTPKDFQSLYQSIYSTTEAVEPRGGGSSPTIPGAEKFVDELPGKVKRVFKKVKKVLTREENEICEMIVEYLISENYADTEESAIEIIANMSEGWMQSIVEAPGEWFGGLRDKARASRAAQMQALKPTPKPGPTVSSPFAKPASRDDSGRLTTYGAGGGAEAERRGQTRAQVMQQGAKNIENKRKAPVNQGPDFGR